MNRAVQEGEPARQLRCFDRQVAAPVCREGALLQLDGAEVVALKLDGLAQAVEDLGTLAELSGLLEARLGPFPVTRRERLAPLAQQLVRGLF